jgi:thymidylate synthase
MNIEHDYLRLLKDILDNGVQKQDRTGTGTISVFGRQIRHKMSEGFPLITTKKMPFRLIATELLWFLRGDSDIRFLWENNCTIWDGDWYKKYKTTCSEPYTLEEVKQKVKDGNHSFHDSMFDMGPIYGKQWRSWRRYRKLPKDDYTTDYRENEPIDQIQNLINDLKTNPDSRRLMVNAWNVGEINQMTLPPCHYGFQCYVREGKYLSLMWNQRSVDTFLGLPFNIASYGLLLTILAKEVNMIPDELIGNLGDVHLYSNHIEQAKEQITREPMKLPELWCLDEYHYLMDEELVGPIPFDEKIKKFRPDFFTMNNYESHPHIKAPLSN